MQIRYFYASSFTVFILIGCAQLNTLLRAANPPQSVYSVQFLYWVPWFCSVLHPLHLPCCSAIYLARGRSHFEYILFCLLSNKGKITMSGDREDPIVGRGDASKDVEERAGAEEEDTGAQIAPIVKLEEVAVSTGEENEDVLLDMKAKLYRFDKDGNQWKERGAGTVKLLKHKESAKVRLVMRQSKTLKICANHLVQASMAMQEHAGSDKSWVWHATDFSDGELKEELFAIRFGSVENAKKFKELFEEIAESQVKKSEEGENAGKSATKLIESLNVKDKTEDSTEHSKEDVEWSAKEKSKEPVESKQEA